jgi:hypothetical protein
MQNAVQLPSNNSIQSCLALPAFDDHYLKTCKTNSTFTFTKQSSHQKHKRLFCLGSRRDDFLIVADRPPERQTQTFMSDPGVSVSVVGKQK